MNHETVVTFRLRPGLKLLRTGPRQFTLLDPASRAHFDFRAEERCLLHVLENVGTVSEALAEYERRFGGGLSRRHLLEFLEQLRGLGLADDGPATPPTPPVQTVRSAPTAEEGGAAMNLIFDLLALLFGWVFHPVWIVVILAMTVLGLNIVIRDWGRFIADAQAPLAIISSEVVLLLSLIETFVVINFPRAVLVGTACRLFGGRVRGFRVEFSEWLTLTCVCDTGDSFALMSERGRWTMLCADLWLQLAICAAAAILWGVVRPGSGLGLICVYTIPPCLFGLSFNCVPFFKFYGYWMICYAIDDPKLRERAMAETHAWLGGKRSPEALTRNERYWFRAYGLGFYAFRVVFDSTLALVGWYWLTDRYGGVGALVLIGLLIWFYRQMIGGLIMSIPGMRWLVRMGGAWWVRWPIRLALVPCFVYIGFIPYTYEVVGECRTIPIRQHGVRVALTDEIEQVHVSEGQMVEPGQVVATLVGRSTRANVAMTRAALDKARASLELLVNGRRSEDIQVANEQVEITRNRSILDDKENARLEKLFRQGMVTISDVEKSRTQRDDARAKFIEAREKQAKVTTGFRDEQVRGAEAKVRELEEKLKYNEELLTLTKLYSPIRGRAVIPYMEERRGQLTKPGDLVTVIQDLSRLRVEVATDEASALFVQPGMRVKMRLYGNYGELLTGKVQWLAPSAEVASKFGNSSFRTDTEMYSEQLINSRYRKPYNQIRIYVEFDDYPADLKADMGGYARIVVRDDVFWRALCRPIARFLRTEVWSWLP